MKQSRKIFLAHHAELCYFILTYAISWTGAFAVVAPKLLRGQPIPKIDGILMFPAMLLGPSVMGILLTRLVEGKSGLRDLFARMRRFRIPLIWYIVLLIPPVTIFVVLFLLARFVSPVFAHGDYLLGVTFGIAAAFFEEIGWMGFAFPKMTRHGNAFAASVALGLAWGCWHMPVINYLGTAVPHGGYWLPYFVAFTVAMTAMRVLIAWVYVNTQSVGLTQLLHMSSTGCLVALSPPQVTPAQEALWYLLYGVALWIVVGAVALAFGRNLVAQYDVGNHSAGNIS